MDKIDENEIARLRHELSIARQTINQLEEHEKRMREKLSGKLNNTILRLFLALLSLLLLFELINFTSSSQNKHKQ